MMGATIAWALARRGHRVQVYEKGPDYPYPHHEAFEASARYDWQDPARVIAADLAGLTTAGNYHHDLERECVLRLGGAGTAWAGLATRMTPEDFRTGSRFGLGADWPIGYDDIEPWLCEAESQLGVSGTDADNPWAPPRSRPYPLPPFELTSDDALIAGRLERSGIHLHTTPQARTRLAFDRRPACMNVGECQVCPNGARYSSTHHLQRAVETGNCRVTTGATVRRVLTDARGRACGVLVRLEHEADDREVAAERVFVAGAAFESARLLLLSRDARHPDGLGNTSGHVGRHLVFHHIWTGHLHYPERLFPGRVGFWTAQSDQFVNPPHRGRVGGVKIELPSRPWPGHQRAAAAARSLQEAMRAFEPAVRCRQIGMHAESDPTEHKRVTLSSRLDRHGDPVAHVHYDSSELDARTHTWARELVARVARGSGATDWEFPALADFGAFNHYMGTCRMSRHPRDGVVDPFGEVHDTPGLYVLGLPVFVGSGGAVNPTLTGIALTLRTAERVAAA
jgi:choline dehydrogenase-like flavoprotein